MSTSRVPDLIDLMVSLFGAAATLGAATPPVAVYDGPIVTMAPDQLALYVGLDELENAGPTAATSTADWAAMGRRAIDERLEVWCLAEAWSGDTDVRTARVAAFGIVAAAADVLRTGDFSSILWNPPVVADLTLRQDQSDPGAVARVTFRVDGKARIGS